MVSNGSFYSWKDRILFWGVTAFIAAGVSWAMWATMQIYALRSTTEVHGAEIIKAGLVADKTAAVIERNTEAINALRLELARRPREK